MSPDERGVRGNKMSDKVTSRQDRFMIYEIGNKIGEDQLGEDEIAQFSAFSPIFEAKTGILPVSQARPGPPKSSRSFRPSVKSVSQSASYCSKF